MLDVSAKTSMNTDLPFISQSIASYFLIVTVVVLITRVWITGTHKHAAKSSPSSSQTGMKARPLPGPQGLPIFGNMLSLSQTSPHLSLMQLAEKFGPVFQIRLGSRPVVVLNGYEAIHRALVKQAVAFAGRPKLFTVDILHASGPIGTTMSFGDYGDRWKLHRKLAESSLRHFTAGSQVKFVESVVSTEAVELVRHLSNIEPAGSGKMSPALGRLQNPRNLVRLSVSNVMSHFMFSKRHSYDDEGLLHLLEISNRFSSAVGSGNPVDFMPWLRLFLRKTTRDFRSVVKDFRGFVCGRIDEHQLQYKDGSERDILDHLVTSGRRCSPDELQKAGVSEQLLLETSIDYFGAGFETVATSLEWCFVYMARHPEIQATLQRELDSVVDRDRLPTLDDREKLPHIESCLLEILRHATVLPFTVPRSTTCDTVLDNYFIPKDTVVFVNLYSAMYDPKIWHQPEVFDATRFLTPDGVIDVDKKKHVIAFGAGRRRCVGSDLARIELFLFFSIFLQHFSVQPSGPGPVRLDAQFGLTRRLEHLDVRLVPRK